MCLKYLCSSCNSSPCCHFFLKIVNRTSSIIYRISDSGLENIRFRICDLPFTINPLFQTWLLKSLKQHLHRRSHIKPLRGSPFFRVKSRKKDRRFVSSHRQSFVDVSIFVIQTHARYHSQLSIQRYQSTINVERWTTNCKLWMRWSQTSDNYR